MSKGNAFFERVLEETLGKTISINEVSVLEGGCINTAAKINAASGDFFLKWNDAGLIDMFETEARGLQLLRASQTIRVPEVYGSGKVEGKSFLLLEFLEPGPEDANYHTCMGEQLAALHLVNQPTFGLDHDNYIGRLPQSNLNHRDWLSFFKEERLRKQLTLTVSKAYASHDFIQRFETFLDKLNDLLPSSEPSLLHGDLWSGNVMAGAGGEACFFDPAVYYGAREMDLAMTRLFGGFDRLFYEAYHAVYPLPRDFEELADLYNLYPLMVHVNLFGPGSGYLNSVNKIVRRYR